MATQVFDLRSKIIASLTETLESTLDSIEKMEKANSEVTAFTPGPIYKGDDFHQPRFNAVVLTIAINEMRKLGNYTSDVINNLGHKASAEKIREVLGLSKSSFYIYWTNEAVKLVTCMIGNFNFTSL